MAVASYATDLTDITTVESGDSFFEFSGYTKGDGAAIETDWYLQGNACASDENNNKTGVGHSIGYDNGANVTYTSGDCFFAWMMSQGPNAIDTYANGGYRLLFGSATGTFGAWNIGGSDMPPNPYGGWVNVVADPTVTVDSGTQPTTSTLRYFGVGFNFVSGIGKGRPVNADAMRFGRGQLSVINGEAGNYGTFSGMATANDATTARWGLFQEISGGYLWKGLMSLGTTTAVDFRDANVNIAIADTPKVTSGFNKVEINNSSSNVEWTAISITAPSSSVHGSIVSKGTFEVVDNATVDMTNCTFTDMNTFTFNGGTNANTVSGTTFRRCAVVTGGGASFTSCTWDSASVTSPSAAVIVSDLADLDSCNFTRGTSGHAVELTGVGSGSMTWDSTLSGYATSTGGTGTSSAGNEAIYITATSSTNLTINVSGGGTIPSIRVAGSYTGTVNVVAGAVTVRVTAVTTTGTPVQNARVYLKKNVGGAVVLNGLTNASGVVEDTAYTYTADEGVNGWVRKSSAADNPKYKSAPVAGTITSTGFSTSGVMIPDE